MYTNSQGRPSRRWDWRAVATAFLAGAVVAGVVIALLVRGHSGRLASNPGSPGTTSVVSIEGPSTTISIPPLVTVPPVSTTVAVPPATVPSGLSVGGTVRDGAGHPVAGAFVIGLDTLTVVRTDAAGRYSMPCDVTVGGITGRRSESLVASPWLLPVEPSGAGSYLHGSNTTAYGFPPSTPGPGYAFSGGASSAAGAAQTTCDGHPLDFVLPAGGTVDIQLLDRSGNPLTDAGNGVPPDDLYLPGLGPHAALETATLTPEGHQVISQLGPGLLRIDGTMSQLNCTGSGTIPDPSVAGADVEVVAGQTARVTCRES